jgi:hypothetical protein
MVKRRSVGRADERIARVSTQKQRQEDERPRLVTYSERQGYVLDDIVEVHGRSAFHGKHKGLLLGARS